MNIFQEFSALIEELFRIWPGSVGYKLRWLYYRRRLKYLGNNVRISPGVRLIGHKHISIGDDTDINFGCMIISGLVGQDEAEFHRVSNPAFQGSEGEVLIGKGVHIAPGVYILGHGGVQVGDCSGLAGGTRVLSMTNHYASFLDWYRRDMYFSSRAGREHACYIIGPVVLGRNVGIASNCVILPGAQLCDESFLAIASVAHQGVIAANMIASGNPAVPIKERFLPLPNKLGRTISSIEP
jgi:acetyltransferase-like isoleucine patch superfamily enzyme